MIKCPNCTGEMNYDVTSSAVKCPYCGSVFNPNELKTEVKTATENKNPETFEGKSYSCTQCGATLLTFDETAITFCSYCGSQGMIESKMMVQNNPDYIIPFEKTKEECVDSYKKIINKSLFIPSYLKDNLVLEKFRGIYIPYVIYNIGYNGNAKNEGRKYSHRNGDYEYYNEYDVNYDVSATYDGISFDLLSKFYDKYSNAIPYDFHKKVPFNPNYLVGYYADTVDINRDLYVLEAKNIAKNDFTSKARKYREFNKYGVSYPTAPLDKQDAKIGMFPVYFLAMRDKANKNIYYAVVNGQSGKAVAELPVDFKKYLIGSLIVAIIIFLLIDNLFVFVPKVIAVIASIFGLISLIVSKSQYNNLKKRENNEDDLGFKSVKKEEKDNKKTKYKHKKLIIAIILPIIVLVCNFVDDLYYYGAALIAFLLVMVSFFRIIKEHNMLVSNKIPQLEARGGDENA